MNIDNLKNYNRPAFTGRIWIRSFPQENWESWFYGKESLPFKTTLDQDILIKNVVESITQERTNSWVTTPDFISKEKADKLYEVLGKIMGKPLKNVDNQKAINYSHVDYFVSGPAHYLVRFGDVDAKWHNGEEITISLDHRA